jgi:hypothetical protein
MNLIFSSSIPPTPLVEVRHTFFSSRNRPPTASQARRHTHQSPRVSVV